MHRNPCAAGATLCVPAILIVAFAFTGGAGAGATFISDSALLQHSGDPASAGGRALLQAKKSCPISFEFQNYTIITSRCKGPQYPAKLCCAAFVEFACPYSDQLNDPTNDCATTMFSYINLYGSYPPGLFASECKDSKRGLECAAVPTAAADGGASSFSSSSSSSSHSLSSAILPVSSLFLRLVLS